MDELLKALNRAKLKIMADPDNTFLGSIMCGLDIIFDDKCYFFSSTIWFEINITITRNT